MTSCITPVTLYLVYTLSIYYSDTIELDTMTCEQTDHGVMKNVMWMYRCCQHKSNIGILWPRMSDRDNLSLKLNTCLLPRHAWWLSHTLPLMLHLTHRGRVTHIYVSKLSIIGSDKCLSPGRCRYLNQCCNIVNWTVGNKLQWNLNRNSCIFIQESAFENVVCEMVAILSRPQCVNAADEYPSNALALWLLLH